MLGAPALWGQAREALRAGKLVRAARRMDLAFAAPSPVDCAMARASRLADGAEALVLICPLVSKARRAGMRA